MASCTSSDVATSDVNFKNALHDADWSKDVDGHTGFEPASRASSSLHVAAHAAARAQEEHIPTRRHNEYKATAIQASKLCCEQGDLLWRNGLTSSKTRFECKPCGISHKRIAGAPRPTRERAGRCRRRQYVDVIT